MKGSTIRSVVPGKSLLGPHNGISQKAGIWNKNNWLPTLDTFRTFIAQNGSWWNQ